MNDLIRQAVLIAIEQLQGGKATEVAVAVVNAMDGKLEPDEFLVTLNEMVMNEELVEVEYVLPDMPNRVKSFLLPKGTALRLNGDVSAIDQ